jgi:hypothetical protein
MDTFSKKSALLIMDTKICKKCEVEKEISFFRDRSKKGKKYFSNICKSCISLNSKKYKKIYYVNNKEKIKIYSSEYRKNNKDLIKVRKKKYYDQNIIKIKEKDKIYYQNNILDMKKYNENYYKNNNKKLLEYQKEYYKNNKQDSINYQIEYARINKQKINRRQKNRRKNDINFKLRSIISISIIKKLKLSLSSKNNLSIIKYLPYTIQDLKVHLESKFESWMNWSNHGKYNKIWNDNDSSTWVWNIDHIVPQSKFYFTSMEDQAFKDCWALSNLRPYSAKQNIIDNARK